MNYSVIMDDGYGDIRIFNINHYDEKIRKSINLLFKRHIILAVVPRLGGYINSSGGWEMSKEELNDQMYLSEYDYDNDEEWKQYKIGMKSFIKEYAID